jgi:hypothetical protein
MKTCAHCFVKALSHWRILLRRTDLNWSIWSGARLRRSKALSRPRAGLGHRRLRRPACGSKTHLPGSFRPWQSSHGPLGWPRLPGFPAAPRGPAISSPPFSPPRWYRASQPERHSAAPSPASPAFSRKRSSGSPQRWPSSLRRSACCGPIPSSCHPASPRVPAVILRLSFPLRPRDDHAREPPIPHPVQPLFRQ